MNPIKLKQVKLFTEEQVVLLIKATINETISGVKKWFEEETDVVDLKTNKILKDAGVDLKKNHKPLDDYIYPSLVKHGINLTDKK